MQLTLKDKLRYSLVIAQSDSENRVLNMEAAGSSMRVLVDKAGHGLALKIWKTYFDEEKMGKFPAFMAALDGLLAEYGAGSPEDSDPKHPKVRNDEDESGEEKPRKHKENKN